MITGIRDKYRWLETDLDLRTFLRVCPHAVLNRCLTITAVDSSSFVPSDIDKARGWTAVGDIAYSPSIDSIEALPSNCCCRECVGFDEWYIFDHHPDPLGNVCHGNVFTEGIAPGKVFAFVNFCHFSLSNPDMSSIADLFWEQVNWMRPVSYLADGQDRLIFATQSRALFAEVDQALRVAENDGVRDD